MLDYLEKSRDEVYWIGDCVFVGPEGGEGDANGDGSTLREAIDAAMCGVVNDLGEGSNDGN